MTSLMSNLQKAQDQDVLGWGFGVDSGCNHLDVCPLSGGKKTAKKVRNEATCRDFFPKEGSFFVWCPLCEMFDMKSPTNMAGGGGGCFERIRELFSI